MESSITLNHTNDEFGGSIKVIASKSHAHRLLIAGALTLLGDRNSPGIHIICSETSKDIEATAFCLSGLGISIERTADGFLLSNSTGTASTAGTASTTGAAADNNTTENATVTADTSSGLKTASRAQIDAGESGSTLRFLLPVISILGIAADITTHGRLTERPLSPLYEEMLSHGASISPQGSNPLSLSGRMTGGDFKIAGNISSQFITGLLFALPMSDRTSRIIITGGLASRPYVDITLDVLRIAGIQINVVEDTETSTIYEVPGNQSYRLPAECTVEGDWSNAAFFLAAGAIRNSITMHGLNSSSKQGDRRIVELLREFGADITEERDGGLSRLTVSHRPLKGIEIDAEDIPDLVPILSLTAAAAEGTTVIRNIERLRIKESDRVATVIDTLTRLGAVIYEKDNTLVIDGKDSGNGRILAGGTVDSYNDHRIAMTAGIASIISTGPVTITNEKAVNKSYPGFFNDLDSLNHPR